MDVMDGQPIGDYALMSDGRCAALASRPGSVDWLCFPQFYAPAWAIAQAQQRAASAALAGLEQRS